MPEPISYQAKSLDFTRPVFYYHWGWSHGTSVRLGTNLMASNAAVYFQTYLYRVISAEIFPVVGNAASSEQKIISSYRSRLVLLFCFRVPCFFARFWVLAHSCLVWSFLLVFVELYDHGETLLLPKGWNDVQCSRVASRGCAGMQGPRRGCVRVVLGLEMKVRRSQRTARKVRQLWFFPIEAR